MDMNTLIKQLAKRSQGVRSNDPDLHGTRGAIAKKLEYMAKKGEVFRAFIHRREVRYFATHDMAMAAENANTPRFVQRVITPKGNTHFARDAVVVVPAHVTVQVCPAWQPRYIGHTGPTLAIQRGRVTPTEESPSV